MPTFSKLRTGNLELISTMVYLYNCSLFYDAFFSNSVSAGNGSLEVPVYFLKTKQICTVSKMEKVK
jgi:hypothetical protein